MGNVPIPKLIFRHTGVLLEERFPQQPAHIQNRTAPSRFHVLKLAMKIQARAVRRCGELLQEILSAQGTRSDLEPPDGADRKLTRTEAASDAGLSEHQRKQALRISQSARRRVRGRSPKRASGDRHSTRRARHPTPSWRRRGTSCETATSSRRRAAAGRRWEMRRCSPCGPVPA